MSRARWQVETLIVKGYALKKITEATGIPTALLHTIAGGE